MLKYLYCKEQYPSIPNEVTLGIFISGCQIRCKGCPSRELWEDRGNILDVKELLQLADKYPERTCICIIGGEHDIDSLTELFLHAHKRIKTAWYCSLDMIPRNKKGIMQYLDYLKTGHYDVDLGALDCPTTNQRVYKINQKGEKVDITASIWNLQALTQ